MKQPATHTYNLDISDINIEVICKKIKNIHLSVCPPEGRVRLAAPLNIEKSTIELFVISKLSWIKKNQRKFANQERQSPRQYLTRESHYFEGRRYLLNVVETAQAPKVEITNKTYIDLYTKPNTSIEKKASIMQNWYRQQLKEQIPPLIEKWEKIMDVKTNEWKIKQMKTKWGTCNTTHQRIWLNLELAKKPISCLEYVIVHELTHLLERNHSPRFYKLMDKFLPDWKQRKRILNSLPVDFEE